MVQSCLDGGETRGCTRQTVELRRPLAANVFGRRGLGRGQVGRHDSLRRDISRRITHLVWNQFALASVGLSRSLRRRDVAIVEDMLKRHILNIVDLSILSVASVVDRRLGAGSHGVG